MFDVIAIFVGLGILAIPVIAVLVWCVRIAEEE